MIIKVKEKQKYIEVYDLDMKLIGKFFSSREASEYISVGHSTILQAIKHGKPIYNKYYVKTQGPPYIEYTKKVNSYTIIRNYNHCRKCGIPLCEKNEFLTASPSSRKKGIKHRFADCRYCVKKRNVCGIRYDDPVLNELCKKQAVILYNKMYSIQHKEILQDKNSKRNKKDRRLLHDDIIIRDIIKSSKIQKILGRKIKKSEITPSMIDVKRKHILLTRKLKELKNE
jgi:hypothetical protein